MPEKEETFFDVETWLEDEEQTIALIVLRGEGAHVVNHHSRMTYEIISGEGEFMLDAVFHAKLVSAGSVVTIERGCGYQDSGDLVMIATSQPPFDPMMVEVIN